MDENAESSKNKVFLVPVIIMVVLAAVLFLPAGSLRYPEACVYWSGFSVLTFFIAVYFSKRSPELLSRRTEFQQKQTGKPPAFLNLWVLCYLIPGFDFRFHWSAEPFWTAVAADAVVFAGYIFIILVFRENSYASAAIKVEEEQRVIATGPYAVVRHPMYLGLILMVLFTPLALGSYWAVIPALLIIPINVFRIKEEEKVLLRDLEGYEDYCVKTPYRLIPLVW